MESLLGDFPQRDLVRDQPFKREKPIKLPESVEVKCIPVLTGLETAPASSKRRKEA